MTFEIIKWFFTVVALIQRFTGRRSEFADAMGMPGIALGALYSFMWCKKFVMANLLFGIGRRNAVGL